MTNKKRFRWLRFAVTILIAAIIGGVLGFFSAMSVELMDVNTMLTNLEQMIAQRSMLFLLCGTIASIVISLSLFVMGYRLYQNGMSVDDEHQIEHGDMRMSWGIGCIALGYIWDLLILGLILNPEFSQISLLLIFTFCLIVLCIIQVKMIDWVKQLMPEKHGDATRMNFRKEWLQSCDEAEQYAIFKASYHTYIITQGILLVLLVICMMLRVLLGIGLSALIVLSLLWAIQTMVYTYFSAQYNREKIN